VRVLFLGDLARTGFGTVTMDLGKAMLDAGEDVRFVSQNELPDLDEPFLSRTFSLQSLMATASMFGGAMPTSVEAAAFLPNIVSGQSGNYFMASGHAWGEWKPEAIILLGDFVAVRLMASPYIEAFRQVPTYHYVPIEGIDLPPRWSQTWQIIRPVAMSEFGADEIEHVMGYRPPVVYHGVSEDFWPATPERPIVLKDPNDPKLLRKVTSKASAREFFGWNPRAKIVLRTDRHMPRKLYNALMRSMAPILMERDDTFLVLHVQVWDQGGDIADTASKFAQKVQDRIVVSNGGGEWDRAHLNALYNTADVYASCSAEGFGLTIAEAIACGIPAVGLQYSAVPEVIGPAGMVVPVATIYDNQYDHFWATPQELNLTASIRWLLEHPHRAQAIGALGPRHVRSRFSWTQAAERFGIILRGGTPEPYDPVPSAEERA
jgi:glycosyltransferase involved in cell wall biosynthesis